MRERFALPAFSRPGGWGQRGVRRLGWLLLSVVVSLASAHAVRPWDAPPSRSPGLEARMAAPGLVLDWRGDRLSIRAREAPWEEVLNELQRQTGVRIQMKGSLSGTLTHEFEALPLEQGLRRLFRQANILWFYSQESEPGAVGERLVRVWLLPKEDTAPEERQVRSLPAGLTAAGTRARPDIVEPVVEGAPRADEANPAEEGAVEEQDPAERLKELDTFAREGNTEALQHGLLDPDEAVRVRALELLEHEETAGH
jgi:hypothetical protein